MSPVVIHVPMAGTEDGDSFGRTEAGAVGEVAVTDDGWVSALGVATGGA
jgi:hypothetical protein